MELSEILNSLSSNGDSTEKTASYNNSGSLGKAIDRALESSTEKTASVDATPSSHLLKIASDLASAEQEALIKEAHIYGMAVADGFAARMSSYQNSAPIRANVGTDTIKEAMELGYLHASSALANYGSSTARGETVKTASYYQGQEKAVKVASYIQGQEEAVKVASYLQGQEDAVKVAEDIVKVAFKYEDFGFQVGNSILRKL